jgi:hypothetical protein
MYQLNITRITLGALLPLAFFACTTESKMTTYKEIQLTNDPSGHCINSTEVFSADDQWIVYDSRLIDSGIGAAGEVAMVNTVTGEIKKLYQTQNQTKFGPGVGAVTFSPKGDQVLFIHGIRNANEANPYAMTRRTGVAVNVNQPLVPHFFDARSMKAPFVQGALRGGTHAHTWSSDGWISYTYNDYLIEQSAKQGGAAKDLRTIGISIPGKKVEVQDDGSGENNSGEMYSLIVAEVKDNPTPGTDEIDKAFDECWIGKNGYVKSDGSRQKRAIAYQGNVRDTDGTVKTQIFVVDIPDDILAQTEDLAISDDPGVRLPVSEAFKSRRITQLEKGVSSSPRHWLRSSSDGETIAFLAEDDRGIVQIYAVSPNGGAVRQITFNDHSVVGGINFSSDGEKLAYLSDNSVFVTEVKSGRTERISERYPDESAPIGSVNWSNDGKTLAFNRFIADRDGESYMQIFLLRE